MKKELKCIQCDSKNVDIIEAEEGIWIEEEVVCKDCGTHMIFDGEEYILHITDCEEWIDLFQETLEFPFDAVVWEYQESSFIKQGDKVKVDGLLDEDDLYGIIVSISKGRKKYSFPIVDLNPINVSRKIKNLLNAYQYWFSNER
jgi:transcription elongation factor Elf1